MEEGVVKANNMEDKMLIFEREIESQNELLKEKEQLIDSL